MSNLNVIEDVKKRGEELKSKEQMYGKLLMMPLVSSNSGSRRIMFATQTEHVIIPSEPEPALLHTGFENEFGKHSSSFTVADRDYVVVAKISKFSFNPDHHYFLIVQSSNGEYGVIERVSYKHITETYGYMFNNSTIDSLKVGSVIPEGKVIHKSTAFDEDNNRQDGVNLITTYLACEHTKEDGIIISESAAKKLASPLIKKVRIIINDNDIPLNIYGSGDFYKSFPNIGEDIQKGILCALRREKKEEMLFAQSYDRLSQIMISDSLYTLTGRVVDINICCNNPECLSKSHYFSQLKYYHDEQMKFLARFNEVVEPIINSGAKCSYELQKLYYNNKKILEGGQYINDRPFSNTIIDFIVIEDSVLSEGDKISNRYGGKGVISLIKKDDEMPRLSNGQYVSVIFNSSTCINRENTGQLFETSLNHISSKFIDYFRERVLHTDEALDMIVEYLNIVVPQQGRFFEEYIKSKDEDDREILLDSIIQEGISISMSASEDISIDTLDIVYKTFPFLRPYTVTVPVKDSNGNTRYIDTRKKLVCGKQYMYRLKQYAEEKFSVVSLSATNIKSENSKNNNKKAYKSAHSRTCIKFGEMETGNLMHLNPETVVINLLLNSLSPKGRRLAEELLTGDPFNIDIKLDDESSNRSVESLNAYLLTMGLEFRFHKIPKVMQPLLKKVFEPGDMRSLLHKVNENEIYDPTYLTNLIEAKAREVEEGNRPLLTKRLIKKVNNRNKR